MEHSLQSYLKRQPTEVLELLLLKCRGQPESQTLQMVLDVLRERKDNIGGNLPK